MIVVFRALTALQLLSFGRVSFRLELSAFGRCSALPLSLRGLCLAIDRGIGRVVSHHTAR